MSSQPRYSADVPCPFCGKRLSRVLDSRGSQVGVVRRRRACPCGRRYTTFEHLSADPKTVNSKLTRLDMLVKNLEGVLEKLRPR